jgi:hypothetical protein
VPTAGPPAAQQGYPAEQLDAIVAPIALYPDELLTQILMASAYPLQVVEASRWLENPANKALRGDELTAALAPREWDPSVKSLVPFPQVLAMMNNQLEWTQQLGYAVAVQQGAVLEAIQRLRKQAEIAGALKSGERYVVRTEGEVITIAPAQPSVIYVPTYNPTVVYGAWPYPAYPPVYLPPPPGYAFGEVLATDLAFGVGIAVVGGLWGWARPNWGERNVYVDVHRYNTINVNRYQINNPSWRPGGPGYRPPAGGGFPPPVSGYGGGRPPGQPGFGNGPPVGASTGRPVYTGARPVGGSGGQPGFSGARPVGAAVGQPANGGARPAGPPPNGGYRPPSAVNRPSGGASNGGGGRPPSRQAVGSPQPAPADRPATAAVRPATASGGSVRPPGGGGQPHGGGGGGGQPHGAGGPARTVGGGGHNHKD